MSDQFVFYEDNKDEFKMWQGLKGPYYTPYVDEDGNLSWTNNGGLPNPATVNIKGAPGTGLEIKGIVESVSALPATAASGDVYLVGTEPPYDGYVYADGGWTYIGVVGVGENGRGIVSIAKTSTVGLVDTYTITYTDGINPTTFTVTNGANGVGVPTGGTAGQVLAKASGTNYDTEWVNQSAGVDPATATPLMDGTGAVGLSAKYAREDHVHPSDTAKQDTLVSGTNIKTLNGSSILGSGDLSVGGQVHVGTSAPSDPNIQIWLDTDEPGMSGVSSVNGMTGAVILDALLWQNASPTSSFAAQAVSFDISGYDLIMVISLFSKAYLRIVSPVIAWVGQTARTAFLDSAGASYYRELTISQSGISFADGKLASNTNNDAVIPYRIYGIKGVAT